MSDDRERIARALYEDEPSLRTWNGGPATPIPWEEVGPHTRAFLIRKADAVLAVLREDNSPKVCPTCGSDDPTYFKPKCMTEFGHVPDPFHSQGEPCDLCGGTGAVPNTSSDSRDPDWLACPRGCKPDA